MNRKKLLAIFLSLAISQAIAAQSDIVTLKATPGVSLPIGTSTQYFNLGLSSDVIAEFRMPDLPLLYFPVNLTYSYLPINSEVVDLALMLIDVGGGIGIDWNPSGAFHLGAFSRAGYAFGIIPDSEGQLENTVVNPESAGQTWTVAAGVFAQLQVLPSLSIGLEGTYSYYGGLYSGISATLGLSYHVQPKVQSQILELKSLKMSNLVLEPVFPVFFKYYDDHTFGSIDIENTGNKTIENVQVSFEVKEYMDNAKFFASIDRLEPGSKTTVEVRALFNQQVLEIFESTLLSASVVVDSTVGDIQYQNRLSESLRVHDRNAITWVDDRRAAAFVTAKDPSVLQLSKYISGQIKDKTSKSLNQKLLTALGLMEALKMNGFSYVIDPLSSYKVLSEQSLSIDYLQFPVQTLASAAGDCDDLTILFCALLESVGIQTAFITIPGHIYMALDLGMSQSQAERQFSQPDELIFMDERAWLPVEVTLVRDGFLKAWQIGAQQWRQYSATNQAAFYPVHQAWDLYEPVGFESDSREMELPDADAFNEVYLDEVRRFIDRELHDREQTYQERIKTGEGKARDINRLGVLYARYGLYDQAKTEFGKILDKENYLPALLNLGNIYTLESDYDQALEYYDRAFDMDAQNPRVVLSLARTHHTLENYSFVAKYYDQLKRIDSDLAEKYSYLESRKEESDRAADFTSEREAVVWDD